ncbi:hypothetical protein B0H14DRAFT_2468169, partial [Mycena olivaceomarginata]
MQTLLLFQGLLYGSFLAGSPPGQSKYSLHRDFFRIFGTWHLSIVFDARDAIRGPLTGEIVFRACVLSVYAMVSATRCQMIVVFGLAGGSFSGLLIRFACSARWHTSNHGRTKDALKRAVLTTLFQNAYTTLFGAYTSHIFLCTSSIVPPLTAHVFCNTMGFPQLQTEMRRFLAQKLVIVGVYIIGIMLFVCTLGPWTEPHGGEQSLYWR